MMFGASYLPNLETDQDRAHCLMDLHQVHDAATAARFIARWRRELEGYLDDPTDTQMFSESLDDLRERGGKLEEGMNAAEEILRGVSIDLGNWAARVECFDDDAATTMADQMLSLSTKVDDLLSDLEDIEGLDG